MNRQQVFVSRRQFAQAAGLTATAAALHRPSARAKTEPGMIPRPDLLGQDSPERLDIARWQAGFFTDESGMLQALMVRWFY